MIRATLEKVETLVQDGWHNAFTDIAHWEGQYYCAYRHAATHALIPQGVIHLHTTSQGDPQSFRWQGAITPQPPMNIDLRDPRFLPTPQALYCLIGAYQPKPGRQELDSDSAGNSIQTYLTSTVTGQTWTPLAPILRTGIWGWSGLTLGATAYVVGYRTGNHGEPSSIDLWSGRSYHALSPWATIYDGSTLQHDSGPHYSPSEPLLFTPGPSLLGCFVRTEAGMDLGIATYPYQALDWRWHSTGLRIHPSGTCVTPLGRRLLVGRQVPEPVTGTRIRIPTDRSPHVWLWALEGQYLMPLLQLPSYGDCAYAGIVAGSASGMYHISYYTQQETVLGPGSDVRIATVRVTE